MYVIVNDEEAQDVETATETGQATSVSMGLRSIDQAVRVECGGEGRTKYLYSRYLVNPGKATGCGLTDQGEGCNIEKEGTEIQMIRPSQYVYSILVYASLAMFVPYFERLRYLER